MYSASDYGKKEEAIMSKFHLQRDDAKNYFLTCLKPRFDRWYKLYISYNGDRSREIKKWQANVFVPYINATVETLIPRIVDARPEFSLMGRTEEDQLRAAKTQGLMDYTWEIADMDDTNEMLVRSSLVYGTGFLQVSWKKDVREHKFLVTKDINKKRYTWNKKDVTFYDAPYAEWVDNYDLWYDWHNNSRDLKQFWFKRKVLNGAAIKQKYPMASPRRLKMALSSGQGDITDYAAIRTEVKSNHDKIVKNADRIGYAGGLNNEIYQSTEDPDLKMYEVFEWWRPFDDAYSVMVNDVPIFDGVEMPIPYNFKAAPFIDVPYLKLPNEFEGYGIPSILESPQIMLNLIKNQRLDAATLNIHKMWIVNPLANVSKEELVTRPFGIIYSNDPGGVREVQFSDIKSSAYQEEEMLKSDMRYSSGVDDFSMGVGGGASSATEVRHLRESTLERVRLFVNHLGDAYSTVMRYWLSMYGQFGSNKLTVRITGGNGAEAFNVIEKDDLFGNYDYKATVTPSIAGKNDIDKKQSMDLFQLLANMPFIDVQKLTNKVLHHWNWDLDSVMKKDEMSPELMEAGQQIMEEEPNTMPNFSSGDLPQSVIDQALAMMPGQPASQSSFSEASMPINLLEQSGIPPTVSGPGDTNVGSGLPAGGAGGPGPGGVKGNPRGLNRTGKVNTNIATNKTSTPEGNLYNRVNNIQS
jgi:hypothetical protein